MAAFVLNIHWNSLELPQPPQSTIQVNSNSGVNIQQFTENIRSLENILQRVNMDFAAALCSRLIYKIKLKFRTTKWLQLIEKINQCLLKLLHLNMSLSLKKIIEFSSSTDHTLPSQSLLEWLLIKLQGFARLLTRLIVTSHRVGVMFRQCLAIGHNWHIIVVLLSLSSQIWTNCQLLLHHSFNTYRVVQQTIHSLPAQKRWTSSQLPDDLAVWIAEEINTLELDTVDVFRIPLPQLKVQSDSTQYYLSSLDHTTHLSSLDHTTLGVNTWDDLGEAISREDLFDKPSEVIDNLSNTDLDEQVPIQHTDSETNSARSEKVKQKKKQNNDRPDETKHTTMNEKCQINSNGKIKKKNKRMQSEDRNTSNKPASKSETNALDFTQERQKVDSKASAESVLLSLNSEVFTKKVKTLIKNKRLMKLKTVKFTEREPVDGLSSQNSIESVSRQNSIESVSSQTKNKSKRKSFLYANGDIMNKKPKTKHSEYPNMKRMEQEIRRKENSKKNDKKQRKMKFNVFNVESI